MSTADSSMSTSMFAGALLGIIEAAGLAAMTLAEGVERDELLASRLTRAEILRQLHALAENAARMPGPTRDAMPEIDWHGWETLAPQLATSRGPEVNDLLWFAVQSLVPATLLWLRVYRRSQAELFRMQM